MDAVTALAALAHETRLAAFRALVPAGPGGRSAGELAKRLAVPAASLSFHLGRLRNAGLITQQRRGRQLFYAADYRRMRGLIDFLTDNCCSETAADCSPDCGNPGSESRAAQSPASSTARPPALAMFRDSE